MKNFCFALLSLFFFSIAFHSPAQVPLPPWYLSVDPSLLAHWGAPKSILLDEHFEGDILPANWSTATQGLGWDTASIAQFGLIPIPEHSRYMLANDGAAGPTNNGCCDYLITPELDLSGYPAYHLGFQSYFTGNYGQQARVEMSTDNGLTWSTLESISPYPVWRQIDIDLSSFSGPGGLSSVKIAFHADDQGNLASGWAVDDINVVSDSLGVLEYQVSFDGNVVGNTPDTFYQFDPGAFIPGNDYTCCVTAIYPLTGMSPPVCDSFPDLWETPPQNLTATAMGDSILFTWESLTSMSYFVRYNVYCPDLSVSPISTTDTSIVFYCPAGELCIHVTAVYDLTVFGFPGCYSESSASTACGYGDGGFVPPYNEDWSSGQFELNRWEAGADWTIDGQVGNDAPSVNFTPPTGKGTYQSTLASWFMDATWITECTPVALFLDFHIRLQDPGASGTDTLSVQVLKGSQVYTVAQYISNGSFEWLMENKEITSLVRGAGFRILFKGGGITTGNDLVWNIDNIHVYDAIICFPPPLEVSVQRLGTPENDLLVSWKPTSINSIEYIMDDGTMENQFGLEQSGETWLGNEFPVSDAGVLQQVSVFIAGIPGASATYSIDIFDAGKSLTGSSEAFVPVSGGWTDVYLPDIPFNQSFYAMLHIQSSGFSDKLGADLNGPNAITNYAWISDGLSWNKFTDFGMEAGVFLLRATALVGDKKMISLSPANQRSTINTDNSSCLPEKKSISSSNTSVPSHATLSDCDTIGYSVYRRAYSSYPPGGNSGNGDWEWLGCTPKDTPRFIDYDLSNEFTNCYEYSIAVIYPAGESLPYGSAWDCIFVGMPESEKIGSIKACPNPADLWVRFDLDSEYQSGTVYSVTGREMERINLKGRKVVILHTSRYSPGTYFVKFLKEEGSSISKIFLIQH